MATAPRIDELHGTPGHGAVPAAGVSATTPRPERSAGDLEVDDMVVEDIVIDGMCGVY